jgi:hypothetical protein
MSEPPTQPLQRLEFDAARLMAEHPPQWQHKHKQLVFEISSPPGSRHKGTIHYSRWPSLALPERVGLQQAVDRVQVRGDVFDYEPAHNGARAVEWHVNFADPELFVAYGSPLLAQDELQAAEHPALGAIRRALAAEGHPTLTRELGVPTPVLIMGVERRCRLATDANEEEGRPSGLYGGQFSQASEATVRRATTAIDPATTTNLIAIAAPGGGYGKYSRDEIDDVLVTAYTAFQAARWESTRARGGPCPVVVHTGFWGCGVFGGHRELMTMLQIVAAAMAGLDLLVYHTVDAAGKGVVEKAKRRVKAELSGTASIDCRELIGRIVAMGYQWAVGDGN